MTSLDRCYRIIQKPVVTEKATDESATRNAYTFRVPMDSNKVEIRQAVERLFGVKVTRVNTLVTASKRRRYNRSIGMTKAWKKAMVTLAEGDEIDLFEV